MALLLKEEGDREQAWLPHLTEESLTCLGDADSYCSSFPVLCLSDSPLQSLGNHVHASGLK